MQHSPATEFVDALFSDATANELLNLYIVTGGSKLNGENQNFLDRLYINKRNGSFDLSTDQLPDHQMNRRIVCALDFVGNGSPALFVGGRSVPWAYGQSPNHQLLNNGEGFLML